MEKLAVLLVCRKDEMLVRQKTPKLVITFPTTTAAMAMETACERQNGRLIPLPREFSGGCGLAWCAEPEMEGLLLNIMVKNSILYEEKRIVQLY